MDKKNFIKQCGDLRPLIENILYEVDNDKFRIQSKVVKKRPEYRLYGNNNRQFCQISAIKQKKCLKVEIKRPDNSHLPSEIESDLICHDTSRPNRPYWQRFYIKKNDVNEIIRLIKLSSKDWMFSGEQKIKRINNVTKKQSYIPEKKDVEIAYNQMTLHGEEISIDILLDQIEQNLKKEGKILHPNWRVITEKNIISWYGMKL